MVRIHLRSRLKQSGGFVNDMKMLEQGLKLIGEKDPKSICRGAELLARSGRPEAAEALLPILRSRSEEVRECVRNALDSLDVAPMLVNWWQGPDPEKRDRALSYAVALAHPGLMEIYRESAHGDMADDRKQTGIGLKRQEPTPEVLQLLETLAADPDKDVRWWAIDSLGIIGEPAAFAILEARLPHEEDRNLKLFMEKALGPRTRDEIPSVQTKSADR
jgi:HEAT repeat protein